MRQFGKKSIFWKWIVSYISVIAIMIGCNIITHVRNWSVMEQRQSHMNQQVLQQFSERLYDNILQLERIREKILTSSHYSFLCRASADQFSSLSYRHYMLCNEVRRFQSLSNGCAKIILYFEDGNYVVSSDNVCDADLYWQVFEKDLGISFEEWKELLQREYSALFVKKTASDEKQGMIYARTVQSGQTGFQRINVFFLYKEEDLKKMLSSHQSDDIYSAALIGKDGDIVLIDIGDILIQNEDKSRVLDAVEQHLDKIELMNGDYVSLSYMQGRISEVCLISSGNIYMENMRSSQSIYAITFLITIFVSIALVILYARSNYKPLQELLDVLGPEEWVSVKYKNEFALVKDKVSAVQKENKSVNLTLRRQNKLFRAEYFAKLLTGNTVQLPEEHLEQFYDIRFVSDVFAVMLFYVESYEEEREEGMELDKAQFILGNVYHEILEDFSCLTYQTCVSDLMALVVNLPEEESDRKGLLDKTMARGQEFINQYFNMGYSVSISNIHKGRTELAAAYQEALQAMEYKRMYGLDDMSYYENIIELSGTGYYYPMEVEQDLIRHIQASNYEGARSVYLHVVEENINKHMISSQDKLRCLMYDLLGTVLKTLDEKQEDEQFSRELRPAKRLAACHGLTQMKEVFEDILKETCEYLNKRSGTEDKETLCEQIHDYIKKNYYDTNLSVTSIAEHFSLPPVMMSRMFRDTVGEKIPVVVSEVRLEAAKKLMCQSSESLVDIAEKAGFGSVRTFTRIFKQMENCTPGQWREFHSECH